jgi:hypothetical protein
MSSELLYFNGVNASRGEYAHAPMTAQQLANLILGVQPTPERLDPDPEQRAALRRRHNIRLAGNFDLKEGVSADDLAQSGWGVIFAAGPESTAIRDALSELLAWRRTQAGDRYRECRGEQGYLLGESKVDFLRRQGAATSGPVDPDRFPYYLLIVGDPEQIPYRFQYQLDVQYAVGRIHFATLAEYAQYARSVVAAEQGEVRLPRRAVFFGVQNPDDPATRLSSNDLVIPLADSLGSNERMHNWHIDTLIAEQATKAALGRVLGGADTPALFFSASHGVEFEPIDSRQLRHQGALLCQDWPGPNEWGGRAIRPDFYFSADDIGDDARLLGTIAVHFACFGGGTPLLNDFPHHKGVREAIAPHAFVAALPQRLLGHPRGGALAVIAHVERAWTFSFADTTGSRQIETFSSMLRRLMLAGMPVGHAMEYFNDRYAELAAMLTEDLDNAQWGTHIDNLTISTRWTAHNDARSYVVIGDPAVRLPLADEAPAERATIGSVRLRPSASATPPPKTPDTEQQTAPESDPALSYGLFDRGGGREAMQKLGETLQEFATQLSQTLEQTIKDAAHLEVETYVSDDISAVDYRHGNFSGARLRAVTRMSLDGDTQVLVPDRDGIIDEELWAIHTSMVQQAQANRAEMIRAIASAAAGLFSAISGK